MARDYLSSWFNSFLMTSGLDKYGRLRVDVAQTGFFEGRVRNSGPPCAGFVLLAICKSGTIFAYITEGATREPIKRNRKRHAQDASARR